MNKDQQGIVVVAILAVALSVFATSSSMSSVSATTAPFSRQLSSPGIFYPGPTSLNPSVRYTQDSYGFTTPTQRHPAADSYGIAPIIGRRYDINQLGTPVSLYHAASTYNPSVRYTQEGYGLAPAPTDTLTGLDQSLKLAAGRRYDISQVAPKQSYYHSANTFDPSVHYTQEHYGIASGTDTIKGKIQGLPSLAGRRYNISQIAPKQSYYHAASTFDPSVHYTQEHYGNRVGQDVVRGLEQGTPSYAGRRYDIQQLSTPTSLYHAASTYNPSVRYTQEGYGLAPAPTDTLTGLDQNLKLATGRRYNIKQLSNPGVFYPAPSSLNPSVKYTQEQNRY